tara:strand:- start:25 stop:1113 length:1089 start_codon:yes stop_codon:yes gene_type:complete
MVTAQLGTLTSQNAGDGTTSTSAQRVLIDFKDALVDYKTTSLDAISMFCEPMTTDTGGDIDITISKPSMAMEEIEEGTTPAYQHTSLRNERVSVKEWGIAVAVTRRMIEDSRFNEVELALNEAKRAVDRHLTQHCIYALMGIGSSVYGTGTSEVSADLIITGQGEAAIELFANNQHGAFYGASPASGTRLYEYGEYSTSELDTLGSHYVASSVSGSATTEIALADVTNAIELMGAKGANPDTILVSPSHYKSLLNLADFTTAFISGGTTGYFRGSDAQHLQSAAESGVVGTLFGLKVVQNAWVPQGRFGIFDTSVKPMTYVERRGLTVEEANPGFGIVGSYMSMRYGMKIVRPEYGVIVYGA